ncbi:MAG: right-handed parallel beta-helix repeat-containing protein [Methanobacteriota archaeon]|nr:MAG: right-handed parallel beta-helix repeat-containing protein [Euryarchaeota archaeon]
MVVVRGAAISVGVAILLLFSGLSLISQDVAASGYEDGVSPDRTFYLDRGGEKENGKSYESTLVPPFPGEWWLELLVLDGGSVEVSVYSTYVRGPAIAKMSLGSIGMVSARLPVTAGYSYDLTFKIEGGPGYAVMKEHFLSTLPPPAELPPFGTVPHAPIHIWSYTDYLDPLNDISGSGTEDDPFVIEGWEISGGVEDGIWVCESNFHLVIRDCFVHSIGYPSAGIYLFVTSNVVIENCYVENCVGSEIAIGSCSSILVRNCVIWNDVYTYHSTDSTFEDNVIGKSRLLLQQCSSITVRGNTLRDGMIASYFIACNDCLVYNNNFMENGQNVYIWESVAVVWDCGPVLGGNYWSDYTGIDSDGDGLGDTPYEIAPDCIDRYPLILPYSG